MFIVDNLKYAVHGWRTNPARMVAQIIVSGIVGQGIFWHFGYDQLGVFMDPKKQFGQGEYVAMKLYPHLPHTSAMAWSIKVVEITTDFVRGPAEGALYRRSGITPDAVANIATQPLWSTLEATEKTVGAAVKPERVTTPEGVQLSLACIYGNIFRLVLTLVLFLLRKPLDRYGTQNVERLLRLTAKGISHLFRSRTKDS